MREMPILKHIMVKASQIGARLLRNNVGVAYQGKPEFKDGLLILRNWRSIAFGVGGPGGSDLIGWKKITITQEMVGQSLAVFVAVEVKSERGRLTTDQRRFLGAVRSAGGIAFHTHDVDEAMRGLNGD